MAYRILKTFVALGIAVLVYSIGVPGCAPPVHWAAVSVEECRAISPDCKVEQAPRNFRLPPKGQDRPPERPDRPQERAERPRQRQARPPRAPQPEPPAMDIYTYSISLGQVDIIIDVDNSSSMAIEHRNIARQLKPFLNQIKDVDYHIAVITTDISASPDNPVRNAYYQDGRFIPIGGKLFLTNENMGKKPSSHVVNAFAKAIEREETTQCDKRNQPRTARNQYDRLYQNQGSLRQTACPSSDERGIYALNLAINNRRHHNFFRPQAHLMVVILSDEDVRSSEKYYNQPGYEQYAPEPKDYPELLVESVHNRFGRLKTMSAHSIIIPPGDSRCLNEQNQKRGGGHGTGRGYYGKQYARLSRARDYELTQYGNLLKGSVISICDKRYGSQLERVGFSASAIRVPLPCGRPEQIKLFMDGRSIRARHKIEGRTLIIEPGMVRLNSKIKLQVVCPV